MCFTGIEKMKLFYDNILYIYSRLLSNDDCELSFQFRKKSVVKILNTLTIFIWSIRLLLVLIVFFLTLCNKAGDDGADCTFPIDSPSLLVCCFDIWVIVTLCRSLFFLVAFGAKNNWRKHY